MEGSDQDNAIVDRSRLDLEARRNKMNARFEDCRNFFIQQIGYCPDCVIEGDQVLIPHPSSGRVEEDPEVRRNGERMQKLLDMYEVSATLNKNGQCVVAQVDLEDFLRKIS